MENKINIAELLKYCPRGMELDCTTWENVTFEEVRGNNIVIKRNNKHPFDNTVMLNEYGCCTEYEDEKCRIFPKGKTTWEGFHRPFKDGDIVAYDNQHRDNLQIFIFKDKKENSTLSSCYLMLDGDELDLEEGMYYVTRFATEEEKQKLFDAIKANGYKWNAETKTLENLPRFKVGDRIRKENNNSRVYTINGVYSSMYGVEGRDSGILIEEQDEWELVPNKFDITTLKPYDKVLVRDGAGFWRPNFFGKDMIVGYRYFTANGSYKKCIPYEGNEHLLGTTDDCDDFYKTWEK